MDSDEDDDNDDKKSEASSEDEPPPPKTLAEVHTFSQMVRYIESMARGAILRLPMEQLAQLCQACARVRYFDGAVHGDVCSAIKVHVRGRASIKPEHVADILEGFAELNAYDKEVFELSIQSLSSMVAGGTLDGRSRSRIVAAVKKVNHQSDDPVVEAMRLQQKAARYEQACNEVAACWQKPGSVSGAAMPLSLR